MLPPLKTTKEERKYALAEIKSVINATIREAPDSSTREARNRERMRLMRIVEGVFAEADAADEGRG